MFAEAVLLVSASAVAVMVAVAFVAVTAAVKSPLPLIVPAAAGVAVQLTATFEVPVTVAPNWIVPPEPTAVGRGSGLVMEIDTGKVTVSEAPVKLHPVASLGAVHPEPEMVALPALAPVTVLPEIVTIPEGDAEKTPPVHPEGAEAALVPPPTMAVGLSVTTAPVGQVGGGGVMLLPPLRPQEEMNPATAQTSNKDSIENGFLFIKAFHFPESQYCELETRLPLPLGGEGGPHRRFRQPGRDG